MMNNSNNLVSREFCSGCKSRIKRLKIPEGLLAMCVLVFTRSFGRVGEAT